MHFAAAVSLSEGWTANIGITMILCNLFAIFLWKSVVPMINSWLGNLGYESRAAYSVPDDKQGMMFNFGFVELSAPELLDRVFGMHDHFTADQLLERLKQARVRISKATVYRTLNVMLDCGMHMGYEDVRRFPDFGFISPPAGNYTDIIDAVIVTHL